MTPREGPEPARVFYGWWVALAFVVTVFLSTGIRFTVALLLAVAVLGDVAMSGSIALTSSMTGDLFGRLSVGSIFGTIFLAHQTGSALGAWLGGALFDATGGYGAAFAIACTLLLIGAGLSLTIGAAVNPAGRTVPAPRPVAGGR